jgi:ribonuclease HI
VVRLEALVESADAEVSDWATVVLDVARRFPRKRRRYVRMTREAPDLLRRLRDLLGDEWWDDLLAQGVLGESADIPDDDVPLSNRVATEPPGNSRFETPDPPVALPAQDGLKRVIVHTDGACQRNPGPGGWAAILRYGGHVRELKGSASSTTNNRMELQAAIAALAALKYRCAVEIVTDSKYLRDGVTRWVARWKANGWKTMDRAPVKNRDLWEQLDEQCARHQVTWCWIRGHAGHPDNERCDALARAEIGRLQGRGPSARPSRMSDVDERCGGPSYHEADILKRIVPRVRLQ